MKQEYIYRKKENQKVIIFKPKTNIMKKKIKINDWFSSENKLQDYFKDNGCDLYSHSVYPIYDAQWEGMNKKVELLGYNYGLAFTVNTAKQYENTEAQVILFCRNNNFAFNMNNFQTERCIKNTIKFNLYENLN